MVTIKRYPNRKLYNTETKQYITLDGIADLIQMDKEVRVIDHRTGEDLTALTLTQIILGYEKKRSGYLSNDFLVNLIRSSSDKISTLLENWGTPAHFFRQLDDEIQRRIQRLVHMGELSEKEAKYLVGKLATIHPLFLRSDILDEVIKDYLDKHQPSCKEDFMNLEYQLDSLDKSLAELSLKYE